MTEHLDKLVDRIRKLLAKASDASVTEAEALTYAAKAQEMLEKHNLSIADLKVDEQAAEVPGTLAWLQKYGHIGWIKAIAGATARAYMCTLIIDSVRDDKGRVVRRYTLFGRPSSTAVAQSMIGYLYATCIRLANKHSKLQREKDLFERGFSLRICERLEEMYQAATVGPRATGTTLPALYKGELEAATALMDEKYPNAKEKKLVLKVDRHHSAAGQHAANSVNLSTQIGKDKTPAAAIAG